MYSGDGGQATLVPASGTWGASGGRPMAAPTGTGRGGKAFPLRGRWTPASHGSRRTDEVVYRTLLRLKKALLVGGHLIFARETKALLVGGPAYLCAVNQSAACRESTSSVTSVRTGDTFPSRGRLWDGVCGGAWRTLCAATGDAADKQCLSLRAEWGGGGLGSGRPTGGAGRGTRILRCAQNDGKRGRFCVPDVGTQNRPLCRRSLSAGCGGLGRWPFGHHRPQRICESLPSYFRFVFFCVFPLRFAYRISVTVRRCAFSAAGIRS